MTPVSTHRQPVHGFSMALAVIAVIILTCLPYEAGRAFAVATLEAELTLCSAHTGSPGKPGSDYTLCPFCPMCSHAPLLLSAPPAQGPRPPTMHRLRRRAAIIPGAPRGPPSRRPSARDPPSVVIA